MANTYTQIHIQTVFAVRKRTGLIQKEWKDELYKYITGIIQAYDHKVLAINGMPDHLHVFFGMRPTQSLSNLMQDIKGSSSKWINDKKFTWERFEWQEACLPVGRVLGLSLIANHRHQMLLSMCTIRNCTIKIFHS